ncbi:MAG TPA: Spy/CpxP family protein refolding chaperone [Pyrinomonadaceae bacterium]|nr:Spy/CpxP family protein refolding chaperone [Pyrinomonadaceae bacterium]
MKEPDRKSSRRKFERSIRRRKFAFAAPALLALFLTLGGANARAQSAANAPAEDVSPQVRRELEARRRGANAAGLLRILNLSPQQRAQIAAIRRETEPQGRLLGARLRQARRALDEAIYAPQADESVVEERAREVSAAQAAVVRLRSLTELRIRRVLSPEQLDAFRRLQRETLRRRRGANALPQTPQQENMRRN